MIVEYVDSLLEKEMSPFKRKSVNKDGPLGQKNAKTGEWDCDCGGGECVCVGKGAMKGRTKKFKSGGNPATKEKYNAKYKGHVPYKRWRSKVRAERDK